MKNGFLTVIALVVLGATQSPAAITAATTNRNEFVISDNASHIIPIDDNNGDGIQFFTATPNQTLIISYSAECTVAANDTQTWLDLDILLDGVAAPPSDDDNAFCTSVGDGNLGSWVSAVTKVVVTVPTAGLHEVQIRGTLNHFSAGNRWRLDDSATTITQ